MDRHTRRTLRHCNAMAIYAGAVAVGTGSFALGVAVAAKKMKRVTGRAQI